MRRPVGQFLDGAARGGDAAEISDPVIGHDEGQCLAVSAPENRPGHRPIEGGRQDLGRAAGRRNHRQLVDVVGRVLRFLALQVGDPLSVGTPDRPAGIRADERRQLPDIRARPCLGDVDVGVVDAIGIGRAVAHKRDPLAVGRPRRRDFVVRSGRDLLGLAGRHVEDVEVIALGAEIPLAVGLEMVPVDDDGRGRLPLPALLLLGIVVRVRVADHEHEACAVWRPLVVRDPALDVGELFRLAAQPVQQPDLRSLLLLRLVAPRREEGEVLVVGAPARRAFAGVGQRGEADPVGAVPAHHPEVAVAAVLLDVNRAHRVRDPTPVRGDLRVPDAPHLREIVERQRARGWCLGRGAGAVGGEAVGEYQPDREGDGRESREQSVAHRPDPPEWCARTTRCVSGERRSGHRSRAGPGSPRVRPAW